MATDTRTAEELEAAYVAGETTITMAQIDKARQTARFAELQAEAAEAQAYRDRVAALEADVEAFKADYAEFASADLSELRDLYNEAVMVIVELRSKVAERVDEQIAIQGRAGHLGFRAKGLGVSLGRKPLIDVSQEEWTRIAVKPEDVDGILHESRLGFVPGLDGRPAVHSLHSDERRDDMAAIRASRDAHTTARERFEAFVAKHNA
jgi:hypothetical protein